jgi:hypothetical protein
MTKGYTVNIIVMKISEDRDQPVDIGEIILAPSGMHWYICYLYIVMRIITGGRNLLDEFMDQYGSQCIQRNNTLEVKTPGLIVIIVIPLTYISKVCYITSRCCSRDNIPKIVLILEMYSLFSFRRYSFVGSFFFIVPDRLTRKEEFYPSKGVKTI